MVAGKARAIYSHGTAPDTPEAHLHWSPLLPLPRGLFRQVNASSLSKSRPNRRSRFIPALGYMTPVPDLRNTLHARVFPSPARVIREYVYARTYACRESIASLSTLHFAPYTMFKTYVGESSARAFSTR